jgi:hypothetical protein
MSQKQRPVVVMVVAILQIVIGGLWLVIDIGQMGMHLTGADQALGKAFTPKTAPAGQAIEPTDANAYMEEHIPHYTAYMWSHFVLDTTLSTLMILSGVGLLRMKRWGRRLAFVYAAYSILLRILTVTYGFMFVIPVTLALMESEQDKAIAQMPPQQQQAAQRTLGTVKTVMRVMLYGIQLGQLVVIIYPILVVILLTRKSVNEAFAAQEMEQAEPAFG